MPTRAIHRLRRLRALAGALEHQQRAAVADAGRECRELAEALSQTLACADGDGLVAQAFPHVAIACAMRYRGKLSSAVLATEAALAQAASARAVALGVERRLGEAVANAARSRDVRALDELVGGLVSRQARGKFAEVVVEAESASPEVAAHDADKD